MIGPRRGGWWGGSCAMLPPPHLLVCSSLALGCCLFSWPPFPTAPAFPIWSILCFAAVVLPPTCHHKASLGSNLPSPKNSDCPAARCPVCWACGGLCPMLVALTTVSSLLKLLLAGSETMQSFPTDVQWLSSPVSVSWVPPPLEGTGDRALS